MIASHPKAGFSIIEVIVAVVLAGVVFIGLFSSLTSIFAISEGSTQRSTASNLAYANLRTYANGANPSWFSCTVSDETASVTLLSKTVNVSGLPGTVTETVIADAPYGCNGAAKGFPIRVQSSIVVGNGIKVSHATYTTY
ncbi:MAG TPA: prepilin-type N-terminal cleavage/methylation domain-containing protein [Patescibacteria group bacterium]|jgi:prepilin-type N-terminal cleavage/methylation domain-containing protein|nr:prepilin-type N-terminal cleavage/methylation domain-containing protein [Patescibacteria group bacterium]